MIATRSPSTGAKPPRMKARSSTAVSSASAQTSGTYSRTASRTFPGGRASTPARSQAKRLSARMAMGRSKPTKRPSSSVRGILPRRQAASQGAPQMRPQIEANGLGPRAIR